MRISKLLEVKKHYKKYNTCNDKFIKIINRAILKETFNITVILILTTLFIHIIEVGL